MLGILPGIFFIYQRRSTVPTKQEIIEQLKEVNYPGFNRDVVSFGIINDVVISETEIQVKIVLKSQDPKIAEQINSAITGILQEKYKSFKILTDLSIAAPQKKTPAPQATFLNNVKYKIAVASGKGGVGKSTIAVNLAIALARQGFSVGLLDADIYGPSMPLMLGIKEQPMFDGQKLIPVEKYGIKIMSLGFLVDSNDAVIWRGALVTRALQQLMSDVKWDGIDIILFDMPPGTGDAQLTLSQNVALDGAIIVSTPQDVALADAIKGVQMFRKVNVPILGIIENMSYFICDQCNKRHEIFNHGGVQKECLRLGTELLGEIPLDSAIRIGGDAGIPVVVGDIDSPQTSAFQKLAETVAAKLSAR
jgi:ATP-binding protein involved in chromosome partitioning